jgi:hypothetical protein
MKETKILTDDEAISQLTRERVRELLEADVDKIKPESFMARLNQAKIGMIYTRDREIMKRVNSGQMIRVITLISDNKEVRKDYITATMPEFKALPIKH